MSSYFYKGFSSELQKHAAPVLAGLAKPVIGALASGAAMAVGGNAVSAVANKLQKPKQNKPGSFNYNIK